MIPCSPSPASEQSGVTGNLCGQADLTANRPESNLETARFFRLSFRQHTENIHSFSWAAGHKLGQDSLPTWAGPHYVLPFNLPAPYGAGPVNVPTLIRMTQNQQWEVTPLEVTEQNSNTCLFSPNSHSSGSCFLPWIEYSSTQLETSLSGIPAASGKTVRQCPSCVLHSKKAFPLW